MITVEQFMKLSPEDSLWRVMFLNARKKAGPYVGLSMLNNNVTNMAMCSKVVAEHPEHFFLDKEEAEEYVEQLSIINKLKGIEI